MKKDIVVVGGGSAGWLTALYIKHTYNFLNVTVVESKEIGILGAGEGSVPYLLEFLHGIDINLPEIVKECDATIKNGIKFTNWNNDNEFFYHPFRLNHFTQLDIDAFSSDVKTTPLVVASIFKNNTYSDIDFIEKISENNKVPFVYKDSEKNSLKEKYENLGNYSIHFNATKFAETLRKIGIDRGINVVYETIKEVKVDKKNNVESFLLENNEVVPCDFVFDCSGFHRLVIGKTFNAKWKSYKNFLPVDSAVPFFLEMTEEIPPYTEAISMKYGWMWKIPLQNRFGCGYVYDSSLISEQEAIKEIEEFLGYEPTYPRKDKGGFSFSAGSYEQPWINNCVAIGLAANFIEPLEATSIWASINMLRRLAMSPEWLFEDNDYIRDEFNKNVVEMNDNIANFIYFHYLGQRKDTDFWKKFSYENAPKNLKEKLDLWKQRFPNMDDATTYFPYHSWLLVGLALNIVNKDLAAKYIENSSKYKESLRMYDYFINIQKHRLPEFVNHKEFLEGLK